MSNKKATQSVKLISSLVLGGVVVLAAAWWFFNKPNTQVVPLTSTTSANSLRSLLGLNTNLHCRIQDDSDSEKGIGEIFVSGDKLAGSFSSTDASEQTTTHHLVQVDKVMYVWNSGENQGFKMPIVDIETNSTTEEATTTTNNPNDVVDLDKEIDFQCDNWQVDNSKFSIPTDINFVDLTEITNQLPAMNQTLPTEQTTRPAQTDDNNATNLMAACNSIADPAAKAACLQYAGQ